MARSLTASHGSMARDSKYDDEIAKFRAARVKEITDEDGWLTLVGLLWMKPGENSLGSDPSSDLILPKGTAPLHAGTVTLDNGKARISVAPGTTITVVGNPVTTMDLRADTDGNPTILHLGTLTFYVMHRGDKYGLRVRDLASPARSHFKGLTYFPLQSKWRITARFEPNNPPKKIKLANIVGIVQDVPSPGTVVFEMAGQTYKLDALPAAQGRLFIVFADKTNNKQTDGAGRFLDTPAPSADGTVILDFNEAYNPPCAFTKYATCPVPPRQNHLPIAVTAGEKKYEGELP